MVGILPKDGDPGRGLDDLLDVIGPLFEHLALEIGGVAVAVARRYAAAGVV
jgi:hypothetical protein